MRIRPAGASDLAALPAIAEAAFGPWVARIGRGPRPMDMDFAAALAGGGVLIAEAASEAGEGKVVGYAVLGRVDRDTALLEAVAVRPDRQGAGIGPRLVAAAEARARRAGARRMTLYTHLRMDENRALYPRLGYRESGRTTADGVARVHFEKPLGPVVARKAPVEGLFGRRRVHGHGAGPAYALYALDLDVPAPSVPQRLFAHPVRTLRLEVGFGAGEHLLAHARGAPDVGLVGVEPFESGMMRAVRALAAEGLTNVRLHLGDARRVLDWLPPGTLERVDVLYPDPWPKSRHWKRRFISREGLDRLARALTGGGVVRFASDIAGYVDWTRAHVADHPAFEMTRDSAEPWPGWPGTRYEAKALREGRAPRYLDLHRL